MKLEFIESGSADCPLLRIYDLSQESVALLVSQFRRLSSGDRTSVHIHSMPGIEPLDGLTLRASVGGDDGVIRKGASLVFEMTLSPRSWNQVAELAQPFARPLSGNYHQWLDETSNISLLITSNPRGTW